MMTLQIRSLRPDDAQRMSAITHLLSPKHTIWQVLYCSLKWRANYFLIVEVSEYCHVFPLLMRLQALWALESWIPSARRACIKSVAFSQNTCCDRPFRFLVTYPHRGFEQPFGCLKVNIMRYLQHHTILAVLNFWGEIDVFQPSCC